MKRILTSMVLMILFFPGLVLGETIDDLEYRGDGLIYENFSDVPFTGNITGKTEQGTIRNGKKEGPWVYYYSNGQLSYKVTYKDNKKEGRWVHYYFLNGQVSSRGDYKDGKKDGTWVYYHSNGQLSYKVTYKDNKKDGPYVNYYDNGQLSSKGTYKDGKEDGRWVRYWSDGSEVIVED